jgi:hypothetical protein
MLKEWQKKVDAEKKKALAIIENSKNLMKANLAKERVEVNYYSLMNGLKRVNNMGLELNEDLSGIRELRSTNKEYRSAVESVERHYQKIQEIANQVREGTFDMKDSLWV